MSKVLFQVSASIAAYKSCHAISRLVQEGHEVQIVASSNLHQFIGPATLEGLTQRPILTQNFEAGRMMDHIHLARWCDIAILCPASANQINKLAAGIADDLIGTLFLAFELKKKPYLLAPAMNVEMYQHPITQKSLKTLETIGVSILTSPTGALACGEYGAGRLLEPEDLLAAIRAILKPSQKQTSGKKILLTSGGTREPIDGVRFLTNLSSGKTGQILTEELVKAGHDVTHLHPGENALPEYQFFSFQDLDSKMQDNLSKEKYDWVIHMAAVSDFSVKAAKSNGKALNLQSKLHSNQNISLELSPNHKIISRILKYSKSKNTKVIGFKLTNTSDKKSRADAIRKVFNNPGVQYVVYNDLKEINSEDQKHSFTIYDSKKRTTQCSSKSALAAAILKIVK